MTIGYIHPADHSLLRRLSNGAALIGLVSVAGAFSLSLPHFGSSGNLSNILLQFSPLALLALGQMCAILVGGFDISAGAVLALSSVVAAHGLALIGWPGLIFAPLTGLLCGLGNGLLIGWLRLPPIIATLGMLLLARALALLASDNGQVVLVQADLQTVLMDFTFGQIGWLPYSTLLVLVIFALVAIFLQRSRAGRRLFLIGGDSQAAKLVGVNVPAGLALAYGLCGLCSGLAGLLILMKTGAGLPTDGGGMELNAIAAAVIGGSILSGGAAHPLRVLIAALFIQVIYTGLSFSAVSPYAGELVMGAVILAAGLLDRVLLRLSK